MAAFDHGWIKNTKAALRQYGFATATALADTYPSDTYDELVAKIGGNLEPIKIEMILCSEAITSGRNQEFQMQSFCRYWWSYVPNGWKYGNDLVPFSVAKMVAGWSGPSTNTGKDPFSQIISRLQSRKYVPEGWRPKGRKDPFLIKMFDGVHFTRSDYSRVPSEDWMS